MLKINSGLVGHRRVHEQKKAITTRVPSSLSAPSSSGCYQLRNDIVNCVATTCLTFNSFLSRTSVFYVICKAFSQRSAFLPVGDVKGPLFLGGRQWMHLSPSLSSNAHEVVEPQAEVPSVPRVRRKKLKGKRAVVKWLKHFRWRKKKEYERMTAEEKILYKLTKAQKKEERLVQALKEIEPAEESEVTHDPEILTPEEHFFFLKMGLKSKNYVPVGIRGVYQGVILNMHLHWKKHQTLKVVVKTFTPDEVKEIAAELARLSGGIVLDIQDGKTIIMYRGKNYTQPPTEIMSPRVTLSRKKALDKSKHRDRLRAVRKFIPKLQQDLELLQDRVQDKEEDRSLAGEVQQPASLDMPEKKLVLQNGKDEEDDSELSDFFETGSELTNQDPTPPPPPLYMQVLEKFDPEQEQCKSDQADHDDGDDDDDDFEKHLRNMCRVSGKNGALPALDEVDLVFLKATSRLRKKKR